MVDGRLIYQQLASLQTVSEGIVSRYPLEDDGDAKGCGCYVTSVSVMAQRKAMLHAIRAVSLFYPISPSIIASGATNARQSIDATPSTRCGWG